MLWPARVLLACLMLALPIASGLAAQEAPGPAEPFDCADAFDLIAMTVIIRCANYPAPPAARARIDAARERLQTTGLATPAEFDRLEVAFCPLMQGTGMVPGADRLYLDDGLQGLSVDGLAEIIAHELEHVRQFRERGERSFKCDYVRDMMACGGCQDRRHPMEREAYDRQDAARSRLLHEPPPLPGPVTTRIPPPR